MKYCVYLTIYSGNKLPPYYIGYSTIKKVHNGYHGTVTSKKYKTIWQNELINNSNLFKTKILSQYKTIAEAKKRESEIQSYFKVDTNSMYINMFIQSNKFSFDRTGIKHTNKTKEKMSATRIGKTTKLKGSTKSVEHKEKIRLALKGKKRDPLITIKIANSRRGKKNKIPVSLETRKKISVATKAAMTSEVRAKISKATTKENNGFFGKKHSEETRKKMSATDRSYLTNSFWWTDGIKCIRQQICPGENWVRGRKLSNTA